MLFALLIFNCNWDVDQMKSHAIELSRHETIALVSWSRKWDVEKKAKKVAQMAFSHKRKALTPRQYALNVIISNCIFVIKSKALVFLTVGPHK